MRRFPARRRRAAVIMLTTGLVGLGALLIDWLIGGSVSILTHPVAIVPAVLLIVLGGHAFSRARGC